MTPLTLYSGGLIKATEVFLGKSIIFLLEAVSSISGEPALPGLLVAACCNPAGERPYCRSGQRRPEMWLRNWCATIM